MSSTRKDSTPSSFELSIAPSTEAHRPRACECRSYQPGGRPYPQGSPHRTPYLAARSLGVALSVILIVLSALTLTTLNRGTWAAPIMSPAITTFFASLLEIRFILVCSRRSHHVTRVWYDGALGVGYTIAFGFLVSFTLPDISRRNPESTVSTAGVGVIILFLMAVEILLQIGYFVSGVMDMNRLRRG